MRLLLNRRARSSLSPRSEASTAIVRGQANHVLLRTGTNLDANSFHVFVWVTSWCHFVSLTQSINVILILKQTYKPIVRSLISRSHDANTITPSGRMLYQLIRHTRAGRILNISNGTRWLPTRIQVLHWHKLLLRTVHTMTGTAPNDGCLTLIHSGGDPCCLTSATIIKLPLTPHLVTCCTLFLLFIFDVILGRGESTHGRPMIHISSPRAQSRR